MKTTLKQILLNEPSDYQWDALVKGLGMPELKYLGNYSDQYENDEDFFFTEQEESALRTEVSLRFILENNGWEFCMFALQGVDGYDRELRLLAVAFARQVKHLMRDPRSLHALDVAERFANGLATAEELDKAWDDAYAVYDPVWRPYLDDSPEDSAMITAYSTVSLSANIASYKTARSVYGNPYNSELVEQTIKEFKRLLDCVESGETYNI